MDNEQITKQAAQAHSNLNSWATVRSILEGGHFYGARPHNGIESVQKIIKREIQKELRAYDEAVAKLDQN